MATMTQRHRAASILERGDTLVISDGWTTGDEATFTVKRDGTNWIREYNGYIGRKVKLAVRCHETKQKAVLAALREAVQFLNHRGMEIRNEVTACQ